MNPEDRLLALIDDAVRTAEVLAERRGEGETSPPARAVGALQWAREQLEPGGGGLRGRLGLAGGASEFVWLPEEDALRDQLREIDRAWDDAVAEAASSTKETS